MPIGTAIFDLNLFRIDWHIRIRGAGQPLGRQVISGEHRRPDGPPEGGREAELVARVRNRDVRAFDELFQSYQPRLDRFLHNLIRRPSLIEEVLNDTMMVVWDRLDSFNGDSKLSTWIFAIAYRKAMKALRRSDEPVESDDKLVQADNSLSPEEHTDHLLKHRFLHQALGGLSADHRTVVDLTYFHEMGYREIAEIMECPVDTVKTRMFHARRHLKRLLAGEKADWL